MDSQNKSDTFEFALFQLKGNTLEKYKQIRPVFLNFLRSLKGFKRIKTYQPISAPKILLDQVIWATEEDMENADEKLRSNEATKPFLELIEKVIYFDSTSFVDEVYKEEESGKTNAELYIYEVDINKIDESYKKRKIFYEFVKEKAPGFKRASIFNSNVNPKIFSDLFYWDNFEDSDQVNKTVQESKEFHELARTIKEVRYFAQLVELE